MAAITIPLPGINSYIDNKTLVIYTGEPLLVLSSAVLNGGYRQARYIINHTVSRNYHSSDPAGDLKQVARDLALGADVVGLMTAVDVKNTVLRFETGESLAVAALCTAGVSNPGAAGLPAGAGISIAARPGTINIILLVNGRLTEPALVNAVITVTEAKTRALYKAGVRVPGGEPATGTTTDAVVVGCTGGGFPFSYAGTATEPGYLMGKAVYEAVLEGLEKYLSERGLAVEDEKT